MFRRLALAALLLAATPSFLMAQAAGRQGQGAARVGRGPAQRPALPPAGRGMNAMQLQQYFDAVALRRWKPV